MKLRHFTIYKVIFLALLVTVFIAGCKKDDDNSTGGSSYNSTDNDLTAASENAAVDAAFDDVSGISDEAADGSLSSYRLSSNQRVMTSCATVSVDTVAVPHRITIDFGPSNCLGQDGNYRRGKIFVDFMGHYRDSGSVHTISFDQYFVNDNQILGTKTVTNNGHNVNGHLSFTVVVNGSVVWSTGFGGGTSTVSSTRTRVWTQGENTMAWNDDVYRISGNSSGTSRNGTSYTMQIITPLKKEIGFRHFTEGVVHFTPGNHATREIDFSYLNGARDNLARVTINGVTFTIQLG